MAGLNAARITSAPLTRIVDALARRRLSPLELVDHYLSRIEAGRSLKAFITVDADQARREARRAGERLAHGDTGALLGAPLAIKDLFATRGLRTTAGSRILRDRIPRADAAAVQRLRSAGAVMVGKTNLHEFAYGVTTENPWWGTARNPHDESRSPGGSSGGSAIAVVAGMCAAALGSDTGGSIRIPASLCGCVGLKPTYGAVPTEGAFPLGFTLDHVGPMARTVGDARLLFEVLSAKPAMRRVSTRGLRIGVLGGRLLRQVQPGPRARVRRALDALRRQGLRLRAIEIPELDWTVAIQLVTLRAEASAVHADWIRRCPNRYGADVRARLQLGALVSGPDYVLAQRARARLGEALGRAFEQVDLLALPTTPIVAPVIGERSVGWPGRGGATAEPVDGALVRLTSPFNLTGLPALSVPCGSAGRLPVGLQLVAPWNEEARLFAVGRIVEELAEAGDRSV